MKILDYVVCILYLVSVCFTLLFLYPRISENKEAWEAQRQFDKKVIEYFDAQIETNDLVLDYPKTISKKPGH